MSIHYNPATRPQFPKALLLDEGVVSKSDAFYKLYVSRARKSREALLAEDFTGPAYWMQDGELHKGSLTGSWDCKPVTKDTEPVFAGGINWGTAYFTTEDAAKTWAHSKCTRYDIYHHEVGDVWSVHYHY